MLSLYQLHIADDKLALAQLPQGKLLINTINAHSFNVAQNDQAFAEALLKGDVLLADGASIVHACRWLKTPSQPKERIAGYDLFEYEMATLERKALEECQAADDSHKKVQVNPRIVLFMGSSEQVLEQIVQRAGKDYPHLKIVTYSPPYKPEFSDADNKAIVDAINATNPDLLWIGMTAPKQEKWTYSHWEELNIHCHVGTIGAVFDFYAGTAKRAPLWWQQHSLEWLYRLCIEPKRMWRRYVIGNPLFLWNIAKERMG